MSGLPQLTYPRFHPIADFVLLIARGVSYLFSLISVFWGWAVLGSEYISAWTHIIVFFAVVYFILGEIPPLRKAGFMEKVLEPLQYYLLWGIFLFLTGMFHFRTIAWVIPAYQGFSIFTGILCIGVGVAHAVIAIVQRQKTLTFFTKPGQTQPDGTTQGGSAVQPVDTTASPPVATAGSVPPGTGADPYGAPVVLTTSTTATTTTAAPSWDADTAV